jgi:methyl coenzyme M reductase beta subunit
MSYKELADEVIDVALEDLTSKNNLDRSSAYRFFETDDYEIWSFLALRNPDCVHSDAMRIIGT